MKENIRIIIIGIIVILSAIILTLSIVTFINNSKKNETKSIDSQDTSVEAKNDIRENNIVKNKTNFIQVEDEPNNIRENNIVKNNTLRDRTIYTEPGDVKSKNVNAKPIIYIYPTKETEVEVKLGNPQYLSCTYPKYEKGWKVTAKPNGDLIDHKTGRSLYALYWEGENVPKNTNLEEGFCIKGKDTASFLEEKLATLGLSDREAEEFIVYWLPKMEDNNYNYIRFETIEEQNEAMPLEVTPKPDNIIRVMMDWKALDNEIEVKEQKLETLSREGYTVVEWGGSELK